MQIDTNISKNLTKDEKELFSIIREVVEKYTPSTQIFAVGGWTRDKLLGIPADDIDLMIDNMSGKDFAAILTKHMGLKDAHIIEEDETKSKHLETAKTYIPLSSGKMQEIDLVQARKDIYTEDSRVPQVQVATPQEDAIRRDLTINAIFYNIRENKVEDFTGMGLKDLISNTIRTPREPLLTFFEDELRVFRTIRFAAKFNGTITPETYKALMNPELRERIKEKISKERIGKELVKTLQNPNPQIGLGLLKDTGLLEYVIAEAVKGTPYEGKMAEFGMDQNNPNHKLTLWGHTMQVVQEVLEKYPEAEPEKRVTMLLAALMHDVGKLYQEVWSESKNHPGHRSYIGHEDESSKLVTRILTYLKMEPYIDQVSRLAKNHMRPHLLSRDKGGMDALRRFIRQMGEQCLNWLDVLNLSIADAYAKDVIRDPNVVQQYQDLEKRMQEAMVSLSPVANNLRIKPVLNGEDIMAALNIKPGLAMKEITEFVKELRDEKPDITKEEAIQKLKENYQSKPGNEIKQASKDKEKISSTCPRQLLDSKIEEINSLFKEKKYYEILTILNQLREEYGNDDNIVRLLAMTILKLLIHSEKCRYNDLIQFILNKAQLNFFDYILCSYVVGILLTIETETPDEAIEEIAQRMTKMSPGTMRNVLDALPKDIFRPELKQKIASLLT